MNAATKTALISAFAIVVLLLLLLGGGAMTGATFSGGMMGSGVMAGISWMWICMFLVLGLAGLLFYAISGQRK